MRKPYWRKRLELDIKEAETTEEKLKQAQAEYEAAGLNLSRVPHRGWRVFGIPKGVQQKNEATYFLVWGGLRQFIEHTTTYIDQFKEMRCSPTAT